MRQGKIVLDGTRIRDSVDLHTHGAHGYQRAGYLLLDECGEPVEVMSIRRWAEEYARRWRCSLHYGVFDASDPLEFVFYPRV